MEAARAQLKKRLLNGNLLMIHPLEGPSYNIFAFQGEFYLETVGKQNNENFGENLAELLAQVTLRTGRWFYDL